MKSLKMNSLKTITSSIVLGLACVVSANGQMEMRQMPGLAMADQTADIAAVVNQRLTTVHVAEGERVTKGQLLATLEYALGKAEYQAAKAIADDRSAINIALIDAAEAESRLQRFRAELETGAGNEMELQEAEGAHQKAIALVERERSQLVRAQKAAETAAAQLDAYIIRAPFSGIITEQHVSIGNMVELGRPIFSIVAADALKVELNLPLALFGKLKGGEIYEMAAGAPVSKDIKAKLKFVSPVIDSASQSFRCVFTIDNKEAELPAGFPVKLSEEQVKKLLPKPEEGEKEKEEKDEEFDESRIVRN